MDFLPERIKSKIKVNEDTGCWEWVGAKNGRGYGKVYYEKENTYTHRLAFKLCFKVELTPEIFICHKCNNTSCCNPSHLFAGTAKDNTDDCIAKGRLKPGISHGDKNGRAKLKSEQVREIHLKLLNGQALHSIACEYSVSYSIIRNISQGKTWKQIDPEQTLNLSLSKKTKFKLDPEKVRQIRQKLAAGQSQYSVAREYSVSPMTIWSISQNKIWKQIDPEQALAPPSLKHPNSRLNPDQVREIREKRANGRTLKSLANEYAVNYTTISQISLGKTWKSVLS